MFCALRVYKNRRYLKKHGKRNERIHQRLATEEASSTAASARRLRTDDVSDCGADGETDGRCGGSVSGCVRKSSDQHFDLRRKESLACHMAESEWLRLFGLLTEQIANYTDKDNRDLNVAAGLALDLCKNVPSKRDLEERNLCVVRLQKIHSSIKHDYVRDILSLSIQKLEP